MILHFIFVVPEEDREKRQFEFEYVKKMSKFYQVWLKEKFGQEYEIQCDEMITTPRSILQRLDIHTLVRDHEQRGKDTFHFSVNDLVNILENKSSEKISLATIYNTIHAFKNKGYLKEILLNSDKSYFDTNVSNHHHFFNESTNELIDLEESDVENIKLKKTLPGKKIKSIEVLVKIANNK